MTPVKLKKLRINLSVSTFQSSELVLPSAEAVCLRTYEGDEMERERRGHLQLFFT